MTDSTERDLKQRADELHATILSENRKVGFDPFYKTDHDFIVSDAIARIKKDTFRRATVHGPSITKDKFTSKYWRKWHKEKVLLENISCKEALKEENLNTKTITSSTTTLPTINSKKSRCVKSHSSFGGAAVKDPSKVYFDSHLLGDANNTATLYKDRHHRKLPMNVADKQSMHDPSAVGARTVGGSISRADFVKNRQPKTETARCDYPPLASLVAENKGTTFNVSPRFKSGAVSTVGATADPDPGPRFSGSTKFHFAHGERFKPQSGATAVTDGSAAGTTPGPGSYAVPRLFEGRQYPSSADWQATVDKFSAQPQGLIEVSRPRLAEIGCFGQGCSRQEHVLYGMCLDGRCFTRASFEGAVVRGNDLRRLAGYETAARLGKNLDGIRDEIALSAARTAILLDPVYSTSALYAAAYAGNTTIIVQLAGLGVDPNSKHPETGYTALHAAVFKCQLRSVQCLLDSFRGALDLEAQDRSGDTALHVGSRLGYDEIVGLICDEAACDPLGVCNLRGELPLDVTRSHRVFQHVRAAIDRNALREELRVLRLK